MRLLSYRSQRRIITYLTVLLVVCGIMLAPQRAFAEDETTGEGLEQIVAETPAATDETPAPAVSPAPVVDTPAPVVTPAPAAQVPEASASDVVAEPAAGGADEQPAAVVTDDAPASDDATVEDEVAVDKQSDEDKLLTGDAEVVKDGTYVIESGIDASGKNQSAGLVLTPNGSVKAGTAVVASTYGKGTDQQWVVTREGDSDWYSIAPSQNENLRLTATGDGGKVYLTEYVPDLISQLWAFISGSTVYGSSYQMVPKGIQKSATDTTIVYEAQEKALDVSGGKPTKGASIIAYKKGEATKANQSFYLVDPNPTVEGGLTDLEGRYRISVGGSAKVIEIYKASSDKGANVEVYKDNGGTHQDIYLQYEGNGFYSAWIMGTKKVLDVSSGSILAGTNILQWNYTGNDNQLWAPRKNADGSYSLVNKMTGLVLGVAVADGADIANCANIAGMQDNGRTNNTLVLNKFDLLSAGYYKIQNAADTSKVLDIPKASTEDGVSPIFYTDGGSQNQRYELVSAGAGDLWRIRTGSSGGWFTVDSTNAVVQMGSHSTVANDANTWKVSWRNGAYVVKNPASGQVLGGSGTKVVFVSAPIPLRTGLVKINARLYSSGLDDPKQSKDAGTQYIVYARGTGDNQKFQVEKSGSYYKITNLVSGLVLAASGDKVVQQKSTGADAQLWKAAIADGGYVKLINVATGKAMEFSGTIDETNKFANVELGKDSAGTEKHQSWKLVLATGWYKLNNHWRYQSSDSTARFDNDINSSGKNLGHYDVLHDIWSSIQSKSSGTKYLIAMSWESCYVGVFTGKKGNWVPYLGFNCGNGSHGVIEGKVKEKNPNSTWKWNPYWSYSLASGNTKGNIVGTRVGTWIAKLDKTWNGSRIPQNPDIKGEKWFTSIRLELGFHTTITKSPKKELGRHVSNGCIRLELKNAKWIYNNIGPGTKCIQLKTKTYK